MKMKLSIFWVVLGVGLAGFVALVIAGVIPWYSEQPPIMMLADMDDQFKVKPQTRSTFFADNKANREPVANTIARDGHTYPFAMSDIDKAEVAFASGNPLEKSEYVLARGQNRFYTFCSPCHNYGGTGDGAVHVRAPEFGSTETMNLTREVARGYSDAKIFHIISVGQNIMPAYGDRISETDRWAIIHFVRELQAKAAAREAASGATAAASTAMDNTSTQTAKGK